MDGFYRIGKARNRNIFQIYSCFFFQPNLELETLIDFHTSGLHRNSSQNKLLMTQDK